MPAMRAHPEAPVTPRPFHVGVAGPIVAKLVDKAEPLPNRIRKIERGYCAGKISLSPDAIGGKAESGIRSTAVSPATVFPRVAAFRERILFVELCRQVTIDIARQTSFEHGARKKNIMPFFDAR